MLKLKFINLLTWLLIFHISAAQNFKQIPDSLKKNSYDELSDKITENSNTNNSIYANAYLLKAKKEKNIHEIIDGYSLMGSVLKNFEIDIKYSDSALNLAHSRMPKALSRLYYVRGHIYYKEKMLKKALDYFLKAYNQSNSASEDLKIKINHSIGMIKNTQGDYDEAITIYEYCEKMAKPSSSSYLLYVLGLSELYNKIGKIEVAEEYITKGILLCKTHPLGYYYLPYFISNRGKNYYKRKQYQKAIDDLSSQQKIIKNNHDLSNYAESSFYIGECYLRLNKQKEALNYFKKVDSVFTVKNDISPLTISAYSRIIDSYKQNENFKEVVFYSDQFIKADKTLYDNYKYLTNKIAKTYDIQEIITSKESLVISLKEHQIKSGLTIILLIFAIVILGYILYVTKIKNKKNLEKHREQFLKYKIEREKLLSDRDTSTLKIKNKNATIPIDENVVTQILNCLEQFEIDQKFLDKEYTVEILATQFKTNSNYLSRVINEMKNLTFTQYINSLRINYLLVKLENEKKYANYTIQALSELCGYNSVQTFTRAFTNQTKMKPSNFLKTIRDNEL